ncbi:unnamed protein product [Fraxinus pennsylvanica]|uniref:Sec16 central conserved domain-containing protein n=1 Tax=Fraxinus pennsylvanica TaxID=56036 RepID=A0AAD2A2N2_9LAMI|nr:unnamed protein product [Fraxinus pennsylvanica]
MKAVTIYSITLAENVFVFFVKNPLGSSISVLKLAEIVNEKVDASSIGMGGDSYLQLLCRQSFPGPLTSRSRGVKELNIWINERIMNYRKGEVLRLLLSLLKIACQFYGKPPFSSDAALKLFLLQVKSVLQLLYRICTREERLKEH